MFKLVKVNDEENNAKTLDTVYKVVVIIGVLAAIAAAAYVFFKKCCPAWCGLKNGIDDDYFCDGNCADCDLDCDDIDFPFDDEDEDELDVIETEPASDDEFAE